MEVSIFKKNGYLLDVATSLMVLLFVYASMSKLFAHQIFYEQLSHDPYIANYASLLTWLVPSAELTIAVALLFKTTQLTASYLFTFLMSLFTIYIAVMLINGVALPCSCGGIIKQLSWKQHLLFNACFLIIGAWVIYHYRKANKT